MHAKIEEFLKNQKELEAKRIEEEKEKEKKKVLEELRLFEKEYSPTGESTQEYSYIEYDSEGGEKFYKKVYFDITDEELAEIKKYSKSGRTNEKSKNPVCVILSVIAIITYVAAFIAGCCIAANEGDATIASICWGLGFISGSFTLGFAEIIKLLDIIKNKMH